MSKTVAITARERNALINNFIDRAFRDVADKDYIAARMVHRHGGLDLQFLWLAEQAVEKYLKAILLYNRRNAKQLDHDLRKAYDRVLEISEIPFDFPEDVRDFIGFLDDYGTNRYFEYSYHLLGEECLQLDRTVWCLRRYCQEMHCVLRTPDGTQEDWSARKIKNLQHPYTLDNPHKFELFRGFLEQVLKNKRSPLRPHLIWKNFYYGSYRKRTIRYDVNGICSNPPLVLHPEAYPELAKLVHFSKPVKSHFESGRKRNSTTGKP